MNGKRNVGEGFFQFDEFSTKFTMSSNDNLLIEFFKHY